MWTFVVEEKGEKMNCCQHKERRAAGRCVDCGRALCKECMRRWKPALCDDCAEIRCSSAEEPARGTVKLSCFLGLAGGSVCALLLFRSVGIKAFLVALAVAYVLAGIPFGWSEISRKSTISLLRIPVLGSLLRGIIAPFAGLVMLPISFYRIKTNW